VIRLTRNRILFIFAVFFVLGITFLVMLSPKTEMPTDKQVRETLSTVPTDTPVKETSPEGLSEALPRTASILPGASDAEIQDFLDGVETSADILAPPDLDIAAYGKKLELIAAGQHPDFPPPPRREDFSSDTDYYKVRLDFYQKKLSEAEGTEYQETFESIIGSIERDIADEEAWIAGSEERRKEKLLDAEMYDAFLERRALIAGLEALPEEDRDFFLKYVLPNIQSDGTLILPIDVSEPSGSPPVSVFPVPSIENGESVSVPIPLAPNLPVRKKTLTEQIGSLDEALMKAYPDIFAYPDIKSREAFSELFPSEGSRQYFRHRQTALHKEYAALLDGQLKSVPKKKREQAIETARQSLLQKWDSDFVDSVIKQLQFSDK
jgi:hypothetical protein